MSNEAQFSLTKHIRQDRSNITVVGAQWGDEGKGKIVDWCAATAAPGRRFDAVIRFNGGHNAGHTLVVHQRAVSSAWCRAG